MTVATPFLLVCYLLATSDSTGRGRNRRRGGKGGDRNRVSDGRGGEGGDGAVDRPGGGAAGRSRYDRQGVKRKRPRGSVDGGDAAGRIDEVLPLPSATDPKLPRPSYFTCRHTYENALVDEIRRYGYAAAEAADGGTSAGMTTVATSPHPGLVRVEDIGAIPTYCDPTYALQSLPDAVVVSGESIKGIAKDVLFALLDDPRDARSARLRERLLIAPRGSLVIHPLVPGMCKGQPKPTMLRRCTAVCDEAARILKKVYPCSRKAITSDAVSDVEEKRTTHEERWVLQIMLQSPTVAVASLAECRRVGPERGDASWPDRFRPLGLANVDIEGSMPSSAYRKLLEAFECMRIRPGPASTVVDLGASPGGWTAALRRLGCSVVAIDRSNLDPDLMKDDMVEFVKGDAFAYEPAPMTVAKSETEVRGDRWMVSDVIAYPDRCTELLDRWCGGRWATHMVVTMKFQGGQPAFGEVDRAMDVVRAHGYSCRVKHFFNNKNEVTFMVSEGDYPTVDVNFGSSGSAMYPVVF